MCTAAHSVSSDSIASQAIKPHDLSSDSIDKHIALLSAHPAHVIAVFSRVGLLTSACTLSTLSKLFAVVHVVAQSRYADTEAHLNCALHCIDIIESLCLAPATVALLPSVQVPDFAVSASLEAYASYERFIGQYSL